jgi:hypothetical protein
VPAFHVEQSSPLCTWNSREKELPHLAHLASFLTNMAYQKQPWRYLAGISDKRGRTLLFAVHTLLASSCPSINLSPLAGALLKTPESGPSVRVSRSDS